MKREAWLRPYITGNYWRFAIIIGLGAITLLSAGALMFTSGALISKSALRPENILMVYVPIVGVRTFGITRAVFHYVERLTGHNVILRILSAMRVRLYRILEPQALFLSSRFRTGDILGILADDVEQLQNVYLRTIFPAAAALVIYAGLIITLGAFDWTFALLAALYMGLLLVVLPGISLLLTHRKHREVKQERNRLYQKLTDAVLGMADWSLSGRHAEFVASYEADEAAVGRKDAALRSWARWRALIGQAIVGLAVVSTIYWTGGQYEQQLLSAPMIAAFVLAVFPIMDVFLPVSEAIERIPQYRSSYERLHEMAAKDEGNGHNHPMMMHESSVAALSHEMKEAEQNAPIVFNTVSHRYIDNDGQWTVRELTLDIPQGHRLAVIGRSGAGKSTLLKLLQGALSPIEGTVTIDGVSAAAFGEGIPRIVSVLNQSPHLFDTSIAHNIRLGRRDATDEEIRRVAKAVKLDEMIESLPLGYDTPMHEAGRRFSGGERQRVALARILLQDTPVVVLDEPTVGLDPVTERELLSTIFQAIEGKTLIWVTHHLIGAEYMDEIVFMDKGRITMQGSHAELIAHHPHYQRLYRLDRPAVGIREKTAAAL
ncbi:putative ABC transporter ATP-binding/permease protein [Paenibacillus plantiphilus]|uniref:ABC transporter ATP-binding/permease protein n=1 Tax=Paenibacillus plantiphilus TaxID=2905650 RepID=A0ABN8GIW6_9BACL|nr:thiol reductant ABC exporter subunit CydC [Paenibacillus plantiphilus]CAH1206294.1 putative ABC transporter ATP-binding/permease protein [Paenibacillus plantiphilus]